MLVMVVLGSLVWAVHEGGVVCISGAVIGMIGVACGVMYR